jgi:hypothetical protein
MDRYRFDFGTANIRFGMVQKANPRIVPRNRIEFGIETKRNEQNSAIDYDSMDAEPPVEGRQSRMRRGWLIPCASTLGIQIRRCDGWYRESFFSNGCSDRLFFSERTIAVTPPGTAERICRGQAISKRSIAQGGMDYLASLELCRAISL